MLVKELTNFIFEKVTIYRQNELFEFEDLYKGNTNGIPFSINEMKVRNIGASKKGVIDIAVYYE